MQTRILGPEGPQVGAIGLGGMPLSIRDGRPSPQEARRVLTRAAELGMTLWDTADAYCIDDRETGHNERLFAAALKELPVDLRERIVIATKGGHVRPEGRWETDGRPAHLRAAIEASLRALETDCITLYQFHRPDSDVPFADSIGALAQAQQQGKIRYVGLSNVSVAQIEEALRIVPVQSVQNQYSPAHLAPREDGVLDKCRELGLAFLPWSPLGGISGAKGIGERGELEAVAGELGVSPQRVVLAWHLSQYDRLIPIPGASRVASVEDSARAAEIELSAAQRERLDRSFA